MAKKKLAPPKKRSKLTNGQIVEAQSDAQSFKQRTLKPPVLPL
jgi:hypothetical protein